MGRMTGNEGKHRNLRSREQGDGQRGPLITQEGGDCRGCDDPPKPKWRKRKSHGGVDDDLICLLEDWLRVGKLFLGVGNQREKEVIYIYLVL